MTRIGYDKPTGVSTPSRPSRPPPDIWRLILTPTILFQTSADFKVSRRHRHRLARPESPQVWSLSAPSSLDVTNTIPLVSLRAHRFSQPLGTDDVRHDLRVYSTPQALLGSWSSEYYPRPIVNCLQSILLLRCYLSFTVFVLTALTHALRLTAPVLRGYDPGSVRPLVPP